MKTRGCWLIRLYSPDYFKRPTLESERGQTVIKLPLSLPYDGETLRDAAVERFQNGHEQKLASDIMKKERVMGGTFIMLDVHHRDADYFLLINVHHICEEFTGVFCSQKWRIAYVAQIWG